MSWRNISHSRSSTGSSAEVTGRTDTSGRGTFAPYDWLERRAHAPQLGGHDQAEAYGQEMVSRSGSGSDGALCQISLGGPTEVRPLEVIQACTSS